MNLFSDLPKGICQHNVPLGPLTWFKLGGPAEYLIEPDDERQLATVLHRCRETGTPFRILGLGANVLVPDEGVCGVVVRLKAKRFSEMVFDESGVSVGCGTDMTRLVLAAVRRGLGGLEPLAGIPGTVGGGIYMNCGGRFGEISAVLRHIRVMGPDGKITQWNKDRLQFDYRQSNLGDHLVLDAAFELQPTEADALQRRFREILDYKVQSQPMLGEQSVGCIFRNPKGHIAGQLIDRAGLKGFRIGSAQVSLRHANFALADKGGRACDVRRLIETIIERVQQRSGVRLDPEVQLW